jgi:hypothetical protein
MITSSLGLTPVVSVSKKKSFIEKRIIKP